MRGGTCPIVIAVESDKRASKKWKDLKIDAHTSSDNFGDGRGVLREQKMLKGHLPRVMCHQVYWYTKIKLLSCSLKHCWGLIVSQPGLAVEWTPEGGHRT